MSKPSVLVVVVATLIGLGVTGREAPDPRVQVVTTPEGLSEMRIPRNSDGHFYVQAMVNGQLVRFLSTRARPASL